MILIAESGSTKTDWRLITAATQTQSFTTDGINPFYQSADQIFTLLNEQLVPHLVAKDVTEIYYYGTGITDDTKKAPVTEALRKAFPAVRRLDLQSDIVAAGRALFGHSAGIAAILGTGSNSVYYDGQQPGYQVPPLGFWLGDEGSGGNLGKQLMLSYLHREMPADIRAKFEETYGTLDRLTVLEHAYRQPNPNRWFAGFAPFMFEHQNHAFIRELIQQSFSDFFRLYLLKYPMVHDVPTGFVGSIAAVFEPHLRDVAQREGVQLSKIIKSPIEALVAYHAS